MARADRLRPAAWRVAVLLAVAGHAALLLASWDAGPAGHAGAGSGPSGARAAQVRLVDPDASMDPGAAARPGPADGARGRLQEVATHTVRVASAALAPPMPASDAVPSTGGGGRPAASPSEPDDEALFLVRSQLDRAPHATGPIDLPYPDAAPLGHYRAVMTLFVDEAGRVRRVRLDADGMLPPLLEDAARQAFLQARFEPGRKDGAAVRSRLRVAVEFGAEPAPAQTAPAASR
ncbi:energy transducer TonB [Leptothrix discophora]|uniref:TonB C-terminal domain-containing protein n=1 Tax=Leptothrix discophora TaxID=89 RepID=A0ABT9G1Q0_LEPDI|nr:hypothetical protein [Leptothrix discophora]MDP4300093.1 hypothetical protein [Leptothrix discophora]